MPNKQTKSKQTNKQAIFVLILALFDIWYESDNKKFDFQKFSVLTDVQRPGKKSVSTHFEVHCLVGLGGSTGFVPKDGFNKHDFLNILLYWWIAQALGKFHFLP